MSLARIDYPDLPETVRPTAESGIGIGRVSNLARDIA